MLSFMSMLVLVYGFLHLYALGKAWAAFPQVPGLGWMLLLAGAVLTLSPLLVHFLDRKGWQGASAAAAWVSYVWMGYLFLFVCTGVVLDAGHGLARLAGIHWPFGRTLAFQIVALLALCLVTYGFFEASRIRVRQLSIETPKLNRGSVTVAQISDLHLGIMHGRAFLDRVLQQLKDIDPDIVVCTGDFIDGQGDDLEALARQFRSWKPRQGAYAVTGNHEYYAGLDRSVRLLRDAGFTVLRGDAVHAAGIVITGVDDRGVTPARQEGGAGAPMKNEAKNFVILLKHQPMMEKGMPFDLQLSGHTHGGQIFPFIYLTRLTYHVHTGLTRLPDGRRLYVNPGLGTWGPPIRLFAPPEITVFRIVGRKE